MPVGLLQLTSCRRCRCPYPSPPLQSVQNAAARLVSGARRHDHITLILATLHRLPVRQRVIFKTAVLVCKCPHDAAPRYLADLSVLAASTVGRRQSRCAVSPPGLSWCPGHGRLLASAALLRMSSERGFSVTRTVALFIQAPAPDPLVCSSTKQCWLQLWVSCTIVRRRCDCAARSAPTVPTQLKNCSISKLLMQLEFC